MVESVLNPRIGESITVSTGKCTIVSYTNSKNIKVEFEDSTLVSTTYGDFIRKNVRNLNFPNVYGIGYVGVGHYKTTGRSEIWNCWYRMFQRCYDTTFHLKQPTYKKCIVGKEWHNFQNFAAWFETEYVDGWMLDKDILIKNNTLYSPTTCCFVPQEINNLFTKRKNKRGSLCIGVKRNFNKFVCSFTKGGSSYYGGTFNSEKEAFEKYKIEKEKYIKEVADKWKQFVSSKVYLAMFNYKIESHD